MHIFVGARNGVFCSEIFAEVSGAKEGKDGALEGSVAGTVFASRFFGGAFFCVVAREGRFFFSGVLVERVAALLSVLTASFFSLRGARGFFGSGDLLVRGILFKK